MDLLTVNTIQNLYNMLLEKKIETEITAAMRDKNELKLEALRTIKSAFQVEKAKDGKSLDDITEIKVIQKLVNQRQESVSQYTLANRIDLVDHENKLLTIFKTYLPEQVSKSELWEAIGNFIVETNATSIKDMGKVMSKVNEKFAGRINSKEVAEKIKELLTDK